MKIQNSVEDRLFDAVNYLVLILLNIAMLYPFIYVVSVSISDPASVIRGEVVLLPVGFSLKAYSQILNYPNFLQAYLNTLFYAAVGTACSLFMIVLAAYPLSLKKFRLRGIISFFYILTMFFGGGMIPTFLVIKNLGLLDTRAAIIMPALLSAWNVVICRSFFQGIPESLHESAYIDGANDWTVLFRIILPLSKPVLATLALFSVVGFWNNFFTPLLYLNDRTKFPVQMILRSILMNAEMAKNNADSMVDRQGVVSSSLSLKTSSIVVTILPVLCFYPFIQKYFVKGVMIGSIKG